MLTAMAMQLRATYGLFLSPAMRGLQILNSPLETEKGVLELTNEQLILLETEQGNYTSVLELTDEQLILNL